MTIGTPTVGTFTEASAATTTSVPYPSTVGAGDCLLLLGSVSNAAGNVTDPAGWTRVAHASIASNTINPTLYAAIKPNAAGTEGGTNLTVTHGNFGNAFQILAFPGVDTTTPQDVAAVLFDPNVNSATLSMSGITPSASGAAIVCAAAANSTTVTATPPSGFTETGDRSTGNRAHENSYLLGQTGATGSLTVTWSSAAKSIGVLIALRPASSAFSGTATLSGDGTLSTTAGLTAAGTATLSGAGTLSTTSAPAVTGATAALSGSGTLGTTATPAASGVAPLSGSGTLSTSSTLTTSGVASLTGSGTLAATGAIGGGSIFSGTATLGGSGTLSTTELPKVSAVATLSGAGTLSASGSIGGAATPGRLPGLTLTVPASGLTLALVSSSMALRSPSSALSLSSATSDLALTVPSSRLEITP